MGGARVTGLFRAIAGEAKAAGSTYFAPARAAAKAISAMAHADNDRAASTPPSRATPRAKAHGSAVAEGRSRK